MCFLNGILICDKPKMSKNKKITSFFIRQPSTSSSSNSSLASSELTPKTESEQSEHFEPNEASNNKEEQVPLGENVTKQFPKIEDTPNQPNSTFIFKKREIGGFKRNFNHKWFAEYKWLHYCEKEHKVFCFYCVKCIQLGLKGDKNFSKSVAFTHEGFDYWNKALPLIQ